MFFTGERIHGVLFVFVRQWMNQVFTSRKIFAHALTASLLGKRHLTFGRHQHVSSVLLTSSLRLIHLQVKHISAIVCGMGEG
jgi:hypothetical protein